MTSVTHIAGNDLNILGRVIQRCALCGDKLIDTKGASVPEADAHLPWPVWPVGRLIRVEGDNPKVYSLLDETDKLPKDSCLDLVEE